jgi:hypothetical protein
MLPGKQEQLQSLKEIIARHLASVLPACRWLLTHAVQRCVFHLHFLFDPAMIWRWKRKDYSGIMSQILNSGRENAEEDAQGDNYDGVALLSRF